MKYLHNSCKVHITRVIFDSPSNRNVNYNWYQINISVFKIRKASVFCFQFGVYWQFYSLSTWDLHALDNTKLHLMYSVSASTFVYEHYFYSTVHVKFCFVFGLPSRKFAWEFILLGCILKYLWSKAASLSKLFVVVLFERRNFPSEYPCIISFVHADNNRVFFCSFVVAWKLGVVWEIYVFG